MNITSFALERHNMKFYLFDYFNNNNVGASEKTTNNNVRLWDLN